MAFRFHILLFILVYSWEIIDPSVVKTSVALHHGSMFMVVSNVSRVSHSDSMACGVPIPFDCWRHSDVDRYIFTACVNYRQFVGLGMRLYKSFSSVRYTIVLKYIAWEFAAIVKLCTHTYASKLLAIYVYSHIYA